MLPFCGYNMADYFAHWLAIGRGLATPPAIFRVNWFRRDADGAFMWPGFGQNMRVLQWIVERARGEAKDAVETPLGHVPGHGDLTWEGLDFGQARFDALMAIDTGELMAELED
ncbi:phosphoenolpyruvate carboxykinase domain-containing protein, partial [Rhizobiaceae sp. 2RAB30]